MLWFWSHGRSISFNLNADLKVNNWETSFIKEDCSIESSNSPLHVYNIYIIKPFLGDPKLLNLETLCILPFQDSWEQQGSKLNTSNSFFKKVYQEKIELIESQW